MENTFDLKKYLIENALTPNSKFLKEQQLSKEEQDAVDYVLGLDEAVLGDIVSRAKEIAKNGLLKGAVLATLLSSPSITQAQKQDIKQVAATTTVAPTQKAPQNAATYEATPKVSVPGAIKTINFGENFDSGKATLTNKDELAKKIEEMKDFLNGKNPSKFKIVIVAGESQVTNQPEFKTPGSLAKARAKAVENVIKDQNLKFGDIEIKTEIGKTPYKKGVNTDVNAQEYKEEQFVTISIVANNDICSMEDVNKNEGQGVAKSNFVTYNDYISGEGELVLDSGTIPDRMVILDSNGNVKQDTGYIATQEKQGTWQYTPAYVLSLTNAYNAGSEAMKNTKLKTISVNSYDELIKELAKVPNPVMSGDEIGKPLSQMKQMIADAKGKKVTFVLYDTIKGGGSSRLKFDQSKGDVQAKVYSPVGKTGYKIKGSCKR
jgi:hypothetical protein